MRLKERLHRWRYRELYAELPVDCQQYPARIAIRHLRVQEAQGRRQLKELQNEELRARNVEANVTRLRRELKQVRRALSRTGADPALIQRIRVLLHTNGR